MYICILQWLLKSGGSIWLMYSCAYALHQGVLTGEVAVNVNGVAVAHILRLVDLLQ